MPGILSTKLQHRSSVKETVNMAREGVNANQVFSSGFPDSTNESDLYLFFGSYGEVTSVKLLINKKTNSLSGAFITFRDCRCAELVLEDQKRRQMFFKGAKINVREAYRDRQGRDFQRQTSGGEQQGGQQHAGGERRGGFETDRSGGYDRGYSGGNTESNKNPFLQSPIFTSSPGTGTAGNNRSSNQYGSANIGQSQGYGMDTRRDDSYNSANRRSDDYNQGYATTNTRQQQGYNDNYNRSSQGSYARQDNVAIDTSRRFDDQNRSTGYQDDYNRSSTRVDSSFNRDSSRMQSGDSGSWADIMDREDRFGDRRVDNRSFDRSREAGGIAGGSYNRDSSMGMRTDNYSNSYNRDTRAVGGYDNNRQGAGYDSGRSEAVGGYDRSNTGYENAQQGYDSYRSSERPVQSTDNYRSQPATNYADAGRYTSTQTDRGFKDGGLNRSGNYGKKSEMSSSLNRSGNFGRDQEHFDQRDSRKRGSEWVGGYEEVPRKQMATPGRDDRPANFNTRSEGNQNPFLQSLSTVPNRDNSMARGPGATSTPRETRGFEQRPANRGRNFDQRRDAKSGFVGGPDRKDRTSARGARGGARRITPRGGGVSTGPNTRQPINQTRQQINRPAGQTRLSDRRGWVGGGSMDTSLSPNRLMAGNMSPTGGLNGGQRFQGNVQGLMSGGVNQQQMMQQQQLQQMQLMRQQQQMAMQQQRGQMVNVPLGGGGGGMQGIMSTLAQLLQNLSKGRGAQQGQVQRDIMRQLNPLERDVVAEVKRSLNVEETPLFASAIMMMRPMDDEVIRIFTQLPQGILMKILRGAAPDEIAAELAKVRNTKSYDNRAEARFHVLRKLLIVLYKVSREQAIRRPLGAVVKPIMQIKRPLDVSRQRLMLAKRRLNLRGGRGGFATRSVGPTDKKDDKKDDKANKVEKKDGEKKEGEKKDGTVGTRGRGAFRRGFGVRGRGGFRGRGVMRGNMRGRGTFRGRGNFRGRGRGGAAKPNGAAKKPETKTTTPGKKTPATTPKASKKPVATNGSAKKTTTPAPKKTPVAKKTVSATAKKTPAKTTPKTTPAKTTPAKTAASTKTTPAKTPTKK